MAFFCNNESSPWNKFCRGPEHQLMLQRAHRYGYDHPMFLCGARVTEVVTSGGKTQQFPLQS